MGFAEDYIKIMKIYQDLWREYTIKVNGSIRFIDFDGVEHIAKTPKELEGIMEELQ